MYPLYWLSSKEGALLQEKSFYAQFYILIIKAYSCKPYLSVIAKFHEHDAAH